MALCVAACTASGAGWPAASLAAAASAQADVTAAAGGDPAPRPAAAPAPAGTAAAGGPARAFAAQVGYARWIGSGWDEDGLALLFSLSRRAGRLLALGVDFGYGHIGVPRVDWLPDYSRGIPVEPAPSVAYASLSARCGPRHGFARPFAIGGLGVYGTDLSGSEGPRVHGGGCLGAGLDLSFPHARQWFRVEYRQHRLFSSGVFGRYDHFSDLTAGVVYGW